MQIFARNMSIKIYIIDRSQKIKCLNWRPSSIQIVKFTNFSVIGIPVQKCTVSKILIYFDINQMYFLSKNKKINKNVRDMYVMLCKILSVLKTSKK